MEGSAVALTPSVGSSASLRWPTLKEAKKIHEFFKPGTRVDFVLLGDVVEQAVHWIGSKGHKILCSAATGSCEACLACGTSIDVSDPQTEFIAPGGTMGKDRRHHQAVLVFTHGMWEGGKDLIGLRELLSDAPARGHRFELRRHSTQKYTFFASKMHARALALALPEAFDLLPWVRARFNRPQDPMRPAMWLQPFAISGRDTGLAPRPKKLDLAPSDCAAENVSPEEAAALAAKFRARGMNKIAEKYAAIAEAGGVEVPSSAAAEPEQKIGDLALTKIVSDPANYTPPTLAGVGDTDDPLIDAPVPDGKLLTRASIETLNERRKKVLANNSPAARAAAAEKGTSRLTSTDDVLTELEAKYPKIAAGAAPGTNGTHAAGGKKGGGA